MNIKPTFNDLIHACPFEFPNPEIVDPEGHGLVAFGADLDPTTLVTAYAHGMFPWFNDDDEPIAWWNPDPRCILYPKDYKPSKSLKKQAKNSSWLIKVNSDFEQVIHNCALPRTFAGQDVAETWITEDMQWAYSNLHQLGFAHSIEVWDGTATELYGGLYGLKLGSVFFGESMFFKQSNASKIAFWYLNILCRYSGVELIDCQMPNEHLISLGANTLARAQFLETLARLIATPSLEMTAADVFFNNSNANNLSALNISSVPSWSNPAKQNNLSNDEYQNQQIVEASLPVSLLTAL